MIGRMRASLTLVFLSALAVPLRCQQTLTVGPGQTYATIGAAITAAAPGDTVLVIGGSYLETIDISKRLQVVGRGALLRTQLLPQISVRIHDLGPNDPVVFSGFTLQSLSGVGMSLSIDRCAGPVVVHDLQNQGGNEMWGLGITDSPQVHLARSLFFSVRATNSVALLEQCVMDPSSFAFGVWAISSVVSLVACSAHGALPGTAAVRLEGGSVLAATISTLDPVGMTPLSGIDAVDADLVFLDPSTQVGSLGGAPPVAGTVPLVRDFSSLRASSDGAVLSLAAHGPANEVFVTTFSSLTPVTATPFGITWLDLNAFGILYAAVYDPVTRNHFATIPHSPILAGSTFAMQTIGLGVDGIRLSMPTALSMP